MKYYKFNKLNNKLNKDLFLIQYHEDNDKEDYKLIYDKKTSNLYPYDYKNTERIPFIDLISLDSIKQCINSDNGIKLTNKLTYIGYKPYNNIYKLINKINGVITYIKQFNLIKNN